MPKLVQGEIRWVNFPAPAGRRPALVLTRSKALAHLTNVTVAPLTRTARGISAEVRLGAADGVPTDCVISLENIITVPQSLTQQKITSLTPLRMEEVFEAIRYVFDMP